MIVRKFVFLLVLFTGFFALQGTMATPLPREKARTEVVFGFKEQRVVYRKDRVENITFNRSIDDQTLDAQLPNHRAFLISYQHHHSSL